MFGVSVLCAFGFWWAPLLWLPRAVFFPLWIALQIVSGRRGDAPEAALDEYEMQQRNSARSIGLTVTQNLMLMPIVYLIFGSVITHRRRHRHGLRRRADGDHGAADRWLHARDDPGLDQAIGRRRRRAGATKR